MSAPSMPLVILVILAAGAVGHALYLWWLVARDQANTDAAAAALAAAQPGEGEAWVWRHVPGDCVEEKLVLAHERESRHQVLQYPMIRPARHIRFAGGHVHLMTESALQKTLEADDVLREKLGLEPIGADASDEPESSALP